jgi:hypothetical protein
VAPGAHASGNPETGRTIKSRSVVESFQQLGAKAIS